MLVHTFISHAKMNLGLQVLNKRKDGYHNIHSLFIEIVLADELVFTPASDFFLTVESGKNTDVPLDESNLITQSYRLLKTRMKNVPVEYAIHLKKNIPIGSGLGGGSSNAATTLRALNQLWKFNLVDSKLKNLGKILGADVPFFIRGGLQVVEGVGDILKPINSILLKNLYFLLVCPPIHISTKWAYGVLNKTLRPDYSRTKFSPLSKPMKWELFENDFERVIYETYPEIREIKAILQNVGALYAGLSGSGSTVFGVFDNLKKAESILGKFDPCQTFLTSPVFR